MKPRGWQILSRINQQSTRQNGVMERRRLVANILNVMKIKFVASLKYGDEPSPLHFCRVRKWLPETPNQPYGARNEHVPHT